MVQIKQAEVTVAYDRNSVPQVTSRKQTRSSLPYFPLDGLWASKYGEKYEMINITYVCDILIATKITGDDNIPAGEIMFQVDFSPCSHPQIPPPPKQKNQNHNKQPQNHPPPIPPITSKTNVQEQHHQQPTNKHHSNNNDNDHHRHHHQNHPTTDHD